MKVLVACEESQAVCKAFRERGHEAYSCDIKECSGGHPEWHILGDAIKTLYDQKWDLVIAHPPCTYLAVCGNRWFDVEKYGEKAYERVKKRIAADRFFMNFVEYGEIGNKIVIENPIGVMSRYYRKPDQIVQPFQFGDPFSKKTCLWIFGLPKLKYTNIVETKGNAWGGWDGGNATKDGKILAWNSEEIKTLRSKTFPGIAKAMAEQWGEYGN